MIKLDKYKGCLIGGAAGDALGYAVEFKRTDSILAKYGIPGITEYELTNGLALLSDDTQMTLFTAAGLLLPDTKDSMAPHVSNIWDCYQEWQLAQYSDYPFEGGENLSGLMTVPELYAWRAPGGTCLTALDEDEPGTTMDPINNSKGCGGIMRVAPIGLYLDSDEMDIKEIDMIGAEAAALTHGHPLGWLPAAALVHIIARIVHQEYSIEEAVRDMQTSIKEQFGSFQDTSYMLELVDKAIELAGKDIDDKLALLQLGEGWVAEETLAVAIYCALKYHDDFEQALIAAVNHDGDSDSTGAVAGNIVGASIGLAGIPEKFQQNLELKGLILKIAEDLYE